MHTFDNSPRAIIVGGGVAGLVAAIRLAQANRNLNVELYEKSDSLGGRARTTNRNECLFNQGPHALYLAGAGHRILKELGVEIRGGYPNFPKQLLLRGGRKYALPLFKAWNRFTTRGLNWRAKLELFRFFSQLSEVDWYTRQGCTVSDWLAETFRTPDMRDFMRLLIRLTSYCNDPDIQSAGVAIRQMQAGLAGVWYLDGGWQSLVDQLVDKAIVAGVTIRSHASVERISTDEGHATGVTLKNGESISAEAVIVATTLQEAAKLMPMGFGVTIRQRAANVLPARTACLDIALQKPPRPKNAFALGMDKPLYLSNHSLTAKLSGDASVFHVAHYLGRHEDGQDIRDELEAALDLVQPGWRDFVIESRFLPNMFATSAIDDAASGGFVGRPGVVVDDLKGLFVCGDWVGGEGLLVDASAASAVDAARRAREYIASQRAAGLAPAG